MWIPHCPEPPPLDVPVSVMQRVVQVESGFQPFAIGVVGGRLQRQPRNLAEAVATMRMLEKQGVNFSVGLAQVNRHNLAKFGLHTPEQAFDTCRNVQVGSRILRHCYERAKDWGKALSCYYSGNFSTGFKHGYVQKVMAVARTNGVGLVPKPVAVIRSEQQPDRQEQPHQLPSRFAHTQGGIPAADKAFVF